MRLKNILNESTEASDIIKDLDKVKTDLIKKVDVLIAKKKKLYSDVDITTPMSADEKKLDKDIQDIFSHIQQLIQQKRKIKTESVNEDKVYIDFLNKEKGFKQDRIKFNSYEDAVKWARKNFDKFSPDMIKYESELKGYLTADVVDDIIKSIGSKFVKGYIENAPNKNYIYLKLTDIKFGNDVVKMLKSKFGIDAKIDKTFGNMPSVSFASKKVISESVNEGKYYVGYNKGRGQGTGVFKDVFSTYKDAKKEVEKIEKQRGGSYNQIAYYVADEKGNFVREVMLGEGRGIKSIQNDLDKTVVAIESEIASYKATKGTPQEKKHIDNLKKLHPIKKKLQSELDMAVSGLYRDAELKIENLISVKEATIKVGGNGKTINGYEVEYFKTARGVYANIEIPSPNPTFDDDTQIKGFGKDEKEAFNDLKKELEKYLKNKK